MDRVLDSAAGKAPLGYGQDSSLRFPDGAVSGTDVLQPISGHPDSAPGKPDVGPDQPAAQPDAVQPDLGPGQPDADPADSGTSPRWYQANSAHCPSHCTALGLTNVPGPEGAHCMSGEARSASGIAQGIQFVYGCWPDCTPQGPHQATSLGAYCYMPGQTKNNDNTDQTVACFCAPKR